MYNVEMQESLNIFAIWPDYSDLAADIDQKVDTVFRWTKRHRIPEDAWEAVIAAAARRGHALSATQILEFNAPMKRRGRPAHKVRAIRRKRIEARAG